MVHDRKKSIMTPSHSLVWKIRIINIWHEASRHIHISKGIGLSKEWHYLSDIVVGIAGADGCKHELVLRMEYRIFRKPINSLFQVHKRITVSRDGVALPMNTFSLAELSSEML